MKNDPARDTVVLTTKPAPAYLSKVEIPLEEDQKAEVARRLSEMSSTDLSGTEIVQLGFEEGQQLRVVLDGFLSRVDTDNTRQLYDLCQRINEGVEAADLPAIRNSILSNPQTSWWQRLFSRSRDAIEEAARAAYDAAVTDASEKTAQLNRFLDNLEGEVKAELEKLREGVHDLQDLKNSYRDLTGKFAISVAVAQELRQQSRDDVAMLKQKAISAPDAVSHTDMHEAETRLELLESRALALESTVSRLPADWVVIQQIQSAGITTFQEVVTTASDRFSSIKMTLLTLHGLLKVKGVQLVAQKQQELDAHLASVRGDLMNQVVRTAAEAPGENRLRQAAQIQKLIDDAVQMQHVVEQARSSNREKFNQARQIISDARQSLTAIEAETPEKLLPKEESHEPTVPTGQIR